MSTRYPRRPAIPVGPFSPNVLRRAMQVLANAVTAAADRVHILATAQRNGAPMDGDLALAAFMAWKAAYTRLNRRLVAYRMHLPDDGFRPMFRRPTEAGVLASLGLADNPEIKDGVAAWAREVDRAIVRHAGYSDGQRVLSAFVAPWGYTVLAWCGHTWNVHGLAEGPKTPHCPVCRLSDEAPVGPSGYYIVPIDDPQGFRLALRGFRHKNNVVPKRGYSVPFPRLLEWRARQEAVAARGFDAPPADSPRLLGAEGFEWWPWAS